MTGLIVILAIQFITPVFRFIPMTVLSAMVISSVVTMIELNLPRKLWRTSRIDLLPLAASFFGCFYELEMGIIAGASVSLVLLLYRNLRPRIDIVEESPNRKTLKINGGLTYPGAEFVAEKLKAMADGFERTDKLDLGVFEIAIDCGSMFEVDYTVLQSFKLQVLELETDGVRVVFLNVESAHVRKALERAGLVAPLSEDLDALSVPVEERPLWFESGV